MRRYYTFKPKNPFGIIAICAITVTLVVAALLFWSGRNKTKPDVDEPLKKEASAPVARTAGTGTSETPQPVIDYEKVEKDPEAKEVMKNRKAEYGIDKGLDMIVRSDESLKVGDEVIPMQEILEKIHLKKGNIVESEIKDTRSIETLTDEGASLDEKIQKTEKRLAELGKHLTASGTAQKTDQKTLEKYADEYARRAGQLADYKSYSSVLDEIRQNEELLKKEAPEDIRKKLQEELKTLRTQQQALGQKLNLKASASDSEPSSLDSSKQDSSDMVQVIEGLKLSQARLVKLKGLMQNDPVLARNYGREYEGLRKIAEDYEAYKTILDDIKNKETLLKSEPPPESETADEIRDALNSLQRRKQTLETKFKKQFAGVQPKTGTASQPPKDLEKAEKRFAELENLLKKPEAVSDAETYQKYTREYAELGKLMADYQEYNEITRRISAKEALLKTDESAAIKTTLRKRANALRLRKNTLEHKYDLHLVPGKDLELYGVYVVQPGDNIWNIHFNFLREYFESRGRELNGAADEPVRGKSSGVGKILKFSEKMVFIYNLRDHKLDVNLNLIHPLSKIVVFNLNQALSLLEQINYQNVSRIQFDGENIWIPAE